MPAHTDIAIVGAGPYGLSIAAHLRARELDHRIFGNPMGAWIKQMPKGMHLKSEGFASNLYDPKGQFTLARYCSEQNIAYADLAFAVPLETFIAYGLTFQQRFVPELENKTLASLSQHPVGFELRFEDGETLTARRVVLAVGIGYFRHIPVSLSHLPSAFLSHSSDHSDTDQFRDRDVIVIGGGSSAIDLAVLLHESGARVQLVARRSSLDIHTKPQLQRPLGQRLKWPISTLGAGWQSYFCANAPLLFHNLPETIRLRAVRKMAPPAAGWFMKDRITNVVSHLGFNLEHADIAAGRVNLKLAADGGTKRQLVAEHIVAATGYRVDLRRIPYLTEEIRSRLRSVENTPILSSNFQSSIPGLYFAGLAAANSFGPLLRFAAGAKFVARRISRHFAA